MKPGEHRPQRPAGPSGGAGGPAGGSARGAAAAVTDLAARLEVSPDVITVASVEEVTWRDASLGCPQPGMLYAQVLTNGSRIVLEAGGKRYEYHSGGRRGPFLCERPQPPLR